MDHTLTLCDDLLYAILTGWHDGGRPYLHVRWRSMVASVCQRWRALVRCAPVTTVPTTFALWMRGVRPQRALASGRVMCASALAAIGRRLPTDQITAMVRGVAGTRAQDVVAVLVATGAPQHLAAIDDAMVRARVDDDDNATASDWRLWPSAHANHGRGVYHRVHRCPPASSIAACFVLHLAARTGAVETARAAIPLCHWRCVDDTAEIAAAHDRNEFVAMLLEVCDLSPRGARCVWKAIGCWGALRTAALIVDVVEADPQRYPLVSHPKYNADRIASWRRARAAGPWLRMAAVCDRPGVLEFCDRRQLPYDPRELFAQALEGGSSRFCSALVATHGHLTDEACDVVDMVNGRDWPSVNRHRLALGVAWLVRQPWFAPRSCRECAVLVSASFSHYRAADPCLVATMLHRWPILTASALARENDALLCGVVGKCALYGDRSDAAALLAALGALAHAARHRLPDAETIDPWQCALSVQPSRDDPTARNAYARYCHVRWLKALRNLARLCTDDAPGEGRRVANDKERDRARLRTACRIAPVPWSTLTRHGAFTSEAKVVDIVGWFCTRDLVLDRPETAESGPPSERASYRRSGDT